MPKKLAKNPSLSSNISTTTSNSTASSATHPFLHSILVDGFPLPRLVVFDLDYTLWPFWVDTHVMPPLKAAPNANHSAVIDKFNESYSFYSDVSRILYCLPIAGVKVAAASRTHAPDLAREMLKLLHVAPPEGAAKRDKARKAIDFFDGGLEIYPGSKLKHMELLMKKTGVAYKDILFFDDEARNREVESLGVTMWLVRDGVTWDEVEKGIREWRKRKGIARK